jgi:transcriptional regulator with XRE-family HTH domain
LVRSGISESEAGQYLGTDQTSLGRWRRGTTVPRLSALAALSEYLGISIQRLEAAREESARVRAAIEERKKATPEENIDTIKAELRAATARIKGLERDLAEALARTDPT